MSKNTNRINPPTPGPWHRQGVRIYRNDYDGRTLICEALPLDYDASGKQRVANAALLSCAPDMLQALQLARDFVRDQSLTTDGLLDRITVTKLIDAAIAKALGAPDSDLTKAAAGAALGAMRR